jgi:Zn-dependent peptidase ImmA (M78 family)
MTPNDSNPTNERSTLAHLRALIPARPLLFSEALRLAELQANRLIEWAGITSVAAPNELVTDLPHLGVEYRDLPTSGMSYWNGQAWIICLNRAEPRTRQRFTLFHEFKHILDHGRTAQLYRGDARTSAEAQAEHAADYFAGCLLMPKRAIKSAWGSGIQQPAALATTFNVSTRAVDVRLTQLGLIDPRPRCASPATQCYRTPPRGTYLRQLSANTPNRQALGAAT